ncbi:MAG: hypothetical protein WAO74_13315 [Polaribacter sp.]|uniref:TlpA family protein disulfide reductase n=1 Tax=Polaribacter sp. TaxID=1920175 RepID=UPI003BB0E53B
MIKNIHYFISAILLSALIGCKSEKKDLVTYFGGKIINPKSNLVVLFSMDKVIDTFLLDDKDKFIGKLLNAQEGLYHFSHGNENQYIYLEPQDSLMIRLNTWDFDESLVFAGIGAERNNILIDCFIDNEKEDNLFYSYNKLNPKEFKVKVDSISALKLNTYKDYLEIYPNETEGFQEILKIALTFPLFARVEKYPLIYSRFSETGDFPKTTSAFYEHRTDIEFNNSSLMYYPPYSNFVKNYLYNETYSLGHPPVKSQYSLKFTIDLLTIIDEKIKAESPKNAFLKQTVVSHFYNKSSCNLNQKPFDKYFELSTNTEDKEHIHQLLNDAKSIKANKRIQNFNVIDYSNTERSIYEIIKGKNTLLFFWSSEFVSESYIVSRMNYLSKTYPNIEFIQIRIDANNANNRIEKLDIKNQFYINLESTAHQFLTSKMPRSILIDKNGIVLNGYASISSYNLNPFLEELNKIN